MPQFRFVGGKGGVGKTTCAAAVAVAAASAGIRTLIVSTDPAPSLADVFRQRLGPAPRRIPLRRGRLDAVEIDAPRALDLWLAKRRDAFERIALRGTWLDRDDVSRLLRLSLPGIDELAALFEITRFARTGRYDLIVVDTAPTGHTLRMLTMPDSLRGMAIVFDRMQAKHRLMTEALRGGWVPDAEDALVDELDRDGRDQRTLLRDPGRVHMSWVTLPESMAIEETADGAAALLLEGIPLRDVIVNRITPPPDRRCGWCEARRELEGVAIAGIAERLPSIPPIAVSARTEEPRGTTVLKQIGAEIAQGTSPMRRRPASARTWRGGRDVEERPNVLPLMASAATRLVLFGGKGGVGKTTCAAAAAIAMARDTPDRRILLLSTDPAHSLADVFGSAISDSAASVPGGPLNLHVREINAVGRFRSIRDRYAAAIDGVFDRLTGGSDGVGLDVGHDRQVMHGLIDLAPPGIDELAAVVDIAEAIESGIVDVVVMDTAPSGHTLRLLEMPALVQDWTKALMSILLKYQPVAGLGELGAVLLKLSRGLGRLRASLIDEARTSFVVVTRPAALPREETVRLLRRLRAMKIHVPAIIVNAQGRGTCARCLAAARLEGREIAGIAGALTRSTALILAPAELPPPHGVAGLGRWQRAWKTRAPAKPRRRRGISSKS